MERMYKDVTGMNHSVNRSLLKIIRFFLLLSILIQKEKKSEAFILILNLLVLIIFLISTHEFYTCVWIQKYLNMHPSVSSA